jgi:hypothetical protein
MDGLHFEATSAVARSDPARADIACFVGFVNCRQSGAALRARLDQALRDLGWTPSPDDLQPSLPTSGRVLPEHIAPSGDSPNAFPAWIERLGWRPSARAVAADDLFARAAARLLGAAVVEFWIEYAWLSPSSRRSAADLLELTDVPVVIDSWNTFDALFAWEARPTVGNRFADTTLGAAVRRFFLHGGRKSYVIRAGDCWPLFATAATRFSFRDRVLKTTPQPTPVDRTTWRGVGHLCGLPDASFLCVPDLPDLFAIDTTPLALTIDPEVDAEERFIECGTRIAGAESFTPRTFAAPRCDAGGFSEWAAFVAAIATVLQRFCREVQFIAAVPLPVNEAGLRADPQLADIPVDDRRRAIATRIFSSGDAQWDEAAKIQTAFVQLAYPWLQTRESLRLPGGVEPPDAMLAGVLANRALTSGAWRSAARLALPGIVDLTPTLTTADLVRELPYGREDAARRQPRTVRDRISVIAPATAGFQLLSDVTTDDDEAYRPANVNRLVSAIVRAARLAGEDVVFTNNGEAVWSRLRAALEDLLRNVWSDGALAGAYPREAFEVRCDRSTLTQADLDAGRIIARVEFTAASPIEQITVVFAMDDGGHVTLVEQPSIGGAAS